ncbi:hypothetical protein LIX17_07870 [Mycobacterium avium subsp. hominissuis]|uniref:Uncharacterized protein n=1 Tax=Mycobacterium bouchedurhonense TaxID=701041 RepID=A0AAW5S5I7_MYCBC|nr:MULTISPECIES: hypothetical protein [Mycobacterium avium complex (MAC)]MBZ4549887.1 hypothetical protein [Mycobacterium avium subsp. hominissuis]MBZ4583271.1 hypothetical protein [Mycobacterium avium subsp. hominissuis]MBZ4595790.1 hypothetical protein [Mycobacterium avium subsp. hominissuis]MCV6989952.1 hypothetical protein [Mycobacterium bouchedurhonense]MCV6995522.1 hypothetical protein [Mycobacterium timonense]
MARREFAAAIHPGAPLTQVRRLAAGPKNGAMRRCPADFRCGTTVLDVRRLGVWRAEFGGRFAAPRQLMATGKAASYCRLCSEYNTRRLDFVFRVSNDIQGTPECICGSDSSTASSALVFAGIGLLNFDFYWLASRSIFLFSR